MRKQPLIFVLSIFLFGFLLVLIAVPKSHRIQCGFVQQLILRSGDLAASENVTKGKTVGEYSRECIQDILDDVDSKYGFQIVFELHPLVYVQGWALSDGDVHFEAVSDQYSPLLPVDGDTQMASLGFFRGSVDENYQITLPRSVLSNGTLAEKLFLALGIYEIPNGEINVQYSIEIDLR